MEHPLITIIIPYGFNCNYDTVLNSIKDVEYPKDKIELIVARGNQPSAQRNRAILKAKGEFIFFFDDDVILKKGIIKKMLLYYKNPKVVAVGGPNLTPEDDTFIQQCFGLVVSSYFGTAKMSSRYKPVGCAREATEKELILCNLSARTCIMKDNLFNETLWPAEENELFNRLRSKNYILMYDPEAAVYHSRRPNVYKFCKQNFGYGRGRMDMFFVQPHAFEPFFLIPTLFLLYLIGFLGLPLMSTLLKTIFLIPMGLYITFALFFSTINASNYKLFKALPILPSLFFLAHVSYGAGMVYGLFKQLFVQKMRTPIVEIAWENLEENK